MRLSTDALSRVILIPVGEIFNPIALTNRTEIFAGTLLLYGTCGRDSKIRRFRIGPIYSCKPVVDCSVPLDKSECKLRFRLR